MKKISYNEKDNFYIYIPLLNQAKIPNGCEAVAATMYLNYLGFTVSTSEFINNYLKKDKAYVINNIIYGPDPSVYYVGDPYSGYGWGAFAPAITNDLNDFFKNNNSKYYAENKTLTNLITLAKYKEPVIIWITTTYEPINELRAIRSYDESDSFIYPHNSHTVLLIGQDKDYYYINDSLKSNSVQKVLKKTLEESYDSNGRQAVIIRSN